MASKYWIKLYHEILDDPKMGKLPDNLWRRAIELFLLAGDLDKDGELLDIEGIAWKLRLTCNETLQQELQALQRCNIVTQLDNGIWFVVHFSKRQEAVEVGERVRRYRDRQRKKAEEQAETEPEEVNQDVTKRYIDIDKDIDTEGDTDTAPPSQKGDYLTDVFSKQGEVTEVTGANPEDQWLSYRDRALAAFPGDWGRTPKERELKKGEIAGFVAERGDSFNIERWERSISESVAHGVNPNNIARFKEVYNAGGSYSQYLGAMYPKVRNGTPEPPKERHKIIPVERAKQDD